MIWQREFGQGPTKLGLNFQICKWKNQNQEIFMVLAALFHSFSKMYSFFLTSFNNLTYYTSILLVRTSLIITRTQWTWVWVNSGSWWWTGRPGVLQSTGSQRVGHDWATEPVMRQMQTKCFACAWRPTVSVSSPVSLSHGPPQTSSKTCSILVGHSTPISYLFSAALWVPRPCDAGTIFPTERRCMAALHPLSVCTPWVRCWQQRL